MEKFLVWFYRFKKRHPRLVMVCLVYIIVPVVAGSILGYEMKDDAPATIPTVVVDHDNSNFSMQFIDYVDATESFDVAYYADSEAEAEALIQEGKAFAGLIIPDDFYRQMRDGDAPDILMLYDATSLAVISVAKVNLSEIMMTMKGAYMKSVFAGKLDIVPEQVMNEVQPINVTYRNLFNPTKSFRYYLLPGMLCAVIQVGISMMGAERGFENKKNHSFVMNILRLTFWSMLGAVSIMLCLGVQFVFFGLPYRGTVIGGILLILVYSATITAMGYIVGTIIPDRTFSAQIAAVLVLPTSILGGYSYPITAMPEFFQELSKWLPYTYLGTDIRNLCLKEMELHHIMPHIIFLLKYVLVELAILLVIKLIVNIIHRWRSRRQEKSQKNVSIQSQEATV